MLPDQNTAIFGIGSLAFIGTLIYIVLRQSRHHVSPTLPTALLPQEEHSQISLQPINDLIIVTDPDLRILSVNDAVERALQRSQSELLNLPIFEVMLMRDKNGKIVSKETFFSDSNSASLKRITGISVMNALMLRRKVVVQVQPSKNSEGKITQINFTFNSADASDSKQNKHAMSLAFARAKYEAILEDMKNQLRKEEASYTFKQLMLSEEIEKDIYYSQLFGFVDSKVMTRVDVVQLCKRTVFHEQEFASTFRVLVDFAIRNFGLKDIEPLIVKNFEVKPEDLTGPFFTVTTDVKKLGMLIKKLLDLLVLLASSEINRQVLLTIEQATDMVIVQLKGSCPEILSNHNLSELYEPYYESLAEKTKLTVGSGLEGAIIKSLSDVLNIPISMAIIKKPYSQIIVTFAIKKNIPR